MVLLTREKGRGRKPPHPLRGAVGKKASSARLQLLPWTRQTGRILIATWRLCISVVWQVMRKWIECDYHL